VPFSGAGFFFTRLQPVLSCTGIGNNCILLLLFDDRFFSFIAAFPIFTEIFFFEDDTYRAAIGHYDQKTGSPGTGKQR
jgi:hypothetical protein